MVADALVGSRTGLQLLQDERFPCRRVRSSDAQQRYKEIQQAYYNAVAARAKYGSSGEAVESEKAAFELMSAKYEYGKANITEFNESKNSLLKAESEHAKAKFEYMYGLALIKFYKGNELVF